MIDFGPERLSRDYEWRLPLISVVFLMLTFFLITGTMQAAGPVKVDLPKGALDETRPAEAVTVYVGADGLVYMLDQVIEARFAPFMLRSYFMKEGHRSVQVKADKNADAETLIDLMEQMREINIEEIVILTEHAR
ncbi:MAG: biopolymer transporter ExbD [Alphaproteobacteria bacterium]|nr:biopolymer transporter ExbD [Alphaproteobacteria bacterium]